MKRIRSVVDDRHKIRDPWGSDHLSMEIWANTLVKTRICELFLTIQGVRGHAIQIQNELNRLANIEGRSGEEIQKAVEVSRFLKNALLKAQEAHREQRGLYRRELQCDHYVSAA